MAGTSPEQAEASYRNAVCSAVAVQRYRDNLIRGMQAAVDNYRRFNPNPEMVSRFKFGLEANVEKAVREFEAFACSQEAVAEAGRMFASGYRASMYRGEFLGPELTASERRRRRGLREEDGF